MGQLLALSRDRTASFALSKLRVDAFVLERLRVGQTPLYSARSGYLLLNDGNSRLSLADGVSDLLIVG